MKRELIIIVAAVLLGIAAVIFYQIQVSSLRAEIKSQIRDKTAICVMSNGIGARQMLSTATVKKEEVPRSWVHPKAVKWDERKLVYGKTVKMPMQKSQPLLWSDLEEQSRRTVDDSILPGRAVVTIPIDPVGGVSGLISPGSRVDVIGVFRKLPKKEEDATVSALAESAPATPEGGQVQSLNDLNRVLEQARTMTLSSVSASKKDNFFVVPIARNLGVFAVGSQTQAGGVAEDGRGGYSTISFDVPEQTQILLIMAMHKVQVEGGRLICVLRSNQASGEEEKSVGTAYPAQDFLEIIPKAQAEMAETK